MPDLEQNLDPPEVDVDTPPRRRIAIALAAIAMIGSLVAAASAITDGKADRGRRDAQRQAISPRGTVRRPRRRLRRAEPQRPLRRGGRPWHPGQNEGRGVRVSDHPGRDRGMAARAQGRRGGQPLPRRSRHHTPTVRLLQRKAPQCRPAEPAVRGHPGDRRQLGAQSRSVFHRSHLAGRGAGLAGPDGQHPTGLRPLALRCRRAADRCRANLGPPGRLHVGHRHAAGGLERGSRRQCPPRRRRLSRRRQGL
jgi:hypothetical protein